MKNLILNELIDCAVKLIFSSINFKSLSTYFIVSIVAACLNVRNEDLFHQINIVSQRKEIIK